MACGDESVQIVSLNRLCILLFARINYISSKMEKISPPSLASAVAMSGTPPVMFVLQDVRF